MFYSMEKITAMNQPLRQCQRSEVEEVRRFVAYAKLRVNEAWIYPPVNGYRYLVALFRHPE